MEGCLGLAHTVIIRLLLAGPLTRKGADIPSMKQTMDPLAKLASALKGEKGVELQLRCKVVVSDPGYTLRYG